MARFLSAAVVLAAFVCVAVADFKDCIDETGAEIWLPGDGGYDGVVNRALYPEPKPAYYIEIQSLDQIPPVAKCANEYDVGMCPRSGGHSFVGQSSCEGAVIDVHKLKAVKYDETTQTVQAEIGNTLGEMYHGVWKQSDKSRIIGIGLCPSVGSAGYLLGGGHNPYSGALGLSCESVLEYEYVTVEGKTIKANSKENKELYWASCGGGGGHFGILYRVTIKTHDAGVFNQNTHFRYEWPLKYAGEVLDKWFDYDQEDGMVWIRLEINANTGLYGYGVCWNSDSIENCQERLGSEEFFNVGAEDRYEHYIKHADDYAVFQGFIGPFGKWGWTESELSLEDSLVGHNWIEGGAGIDRLYSSSFWKIQGGNRPTVSELQAVAEACADINNDNIDFTLCQFNPWKGANRQSQGKSFAFAHKDFDVFTELIGGYNAVADEGRAADGAAEMKKMETAVRDLTTKFIGGIFVNYPEFGLAESDYQYLYWGQNLERLALLREKMDPKGLFQNKQGLPSGELVCPAEMEVSGSGSTRKVAIDGYTLGQLSGMRLAFSLSKGCELDLESSKLGSFFEVDASGTDEDVYEVMFDGVDPATLELTSDDDVDDCKVTLIAINGISCGSAKLSASEAADDTESPAGDGGEEIEETEKESSKACFPASAKVETETRGVVSMEELAVGDRVRVSDTEFSTVYFFSHQSAAPSKAGFVTVSTCDVDTSDDAECATSVDSCKTTLRRVTVSVGHYFATESGSLVAASALKTGDVVEAISASGTATVVEVSDAGFKRGLYNPHTFAGKIVVDGVLTSCYTQAVHPVVARVLLAPLAALYRFAETSPSVKGLMDVVRPHLGAIAGPLVV